MKTIVAGSRSMTNKKEIFAHLDAINLSGISEVVSGGAEGVDLIGEDWAIERGIPVKRFDPDWKLYGKQAGKVRNAQMARYVGRPGRLVAFWDGKSNGTSHMIETAEILGLEVWTFTR